MTMWNARLLLVLAVVLKASNSEYYGTYYCQQGRDVLVQLFEWKWTDVENECRWLAQHRFCAVQVRIIDMIQADVLKKNLMHFHSLSVNCN